MAPLLLLTALSSQPESWYGPATVSFPLRVEESPYDAAATDVRVEFTSAKGKTTRLAFFDGKTWRAILLAKTPGVYKARVLLNGKPARELAEPIRLLSKSSARFIRIDKATNRFATSDASPFWPVGHNLGWQSANFKPVLTDQIALMGKNGLNWSRIWACHWDGKNPFWLEDQPPLKNPRDFYPKVLNRWSEIVHAAKKAGVFFQFVLFHHGQFSSRVNPNWPDHPWNKAKGGFLEKPDDFFTHPEAIRRSKNWLRYAIARWGHEPSVMAWELFNEVEWCDAIQSNPAAVGKWHEDMAKYIRSLDPYRHLVTSSSGMELPIWKAMDYYQPHGYPPDVGAMVMGRRPTTDKPLFYGEVGIGEGAADERKVIRDSLWAGLMAGHAGAAQYWYWDRMNEGLYREYRRFTSFVRDHKLTEGTFLKPVPVEIESPIGGAVSFAPGQGWAKTTQFDFSMPADANSGALGRLSGFIQGPNKKDMMAEPIRFTFESPTPGRFEMRVGTVARQGAQIQLLLDDKLVVDEKVASQGQDIQLNKTFAVDLTAGKHTVTVANGGPDWYVASHFKIDGIGRLVSGSAAVSGARCLLRLGQNSMSDTAAFFNFSGAGLLGDRYQAVILDLDTGLINKRELVRKDGQFRASMSSKEAIWLLTK